MITNKYENSTNNIIMLYIKNLTVVHGIINTIKYINTLIIQFIPKAVLKI